MKHVPTQPSQARKSPVPPLRPGQRLKQPEFHRRYEQYPEDVKFELIGGVVYMTSPLRQPHGSYHPELSGVLWLYKGGTPGIEVLDNATTILGEESEPQPDLALRILHEFGGQARVNEGEYIEGAPELLAEIAHSSRDIDLNEKRIDYQRAGVLEYLVLSIAEQELHWFHFPSQEVIAPNRRGVARSRVFPGLWIDVRALLARDSGRLVETIQKGLASREHARFVRRLATRREGSG